jgi:hypothetical protein
MYNTSAQSIKTGHSNPVAIATGLVRWPEKSAGVGWPCTGIAYFFLEFFVTFCFKTKS